jgi:hypothetical protein
MQREKVRVTAVRWLHPFGTRITPGFFLSHRTVVVGTDGRTGDSWMYGLMVFAAL